MSISVHFDTSSFNNALRELVKSSSKSPEYVLTRQARNLCFALIKATPRAKRADIIKGATPFLWKVVKLGDKGLVRIVPVGTPKKDNKTPEFPYYSIGRRLSAINYSRLGWYKAAQKLGVSFNVKAGPAENEGAVTLKLAGDATEITITNNTDGIEKNNSRHGILKTAFEGRVADMEQELQRRYQADFNKVKP